MQRTKKVVKNKIQKPKTKTKTNKPKMTITEKPAIQNVVAPLAQSAVIRTPTNMKHKCTTFERVEALGPITGNTANFAIAGSYSINPGLSATFPWLAAPATAFNMYKFRKLRIFYKNSTSSTNTGVVVIGYNPDPNDIAPTTLSQIENYETRVRIATWEDSYVDVPYEDLNRLRKFLVRSSIVPGELATYDIGSIYVAVSGNNSSTTTVGEIWVEYIVDMYAPITASLAIPYAKANTIYTQLAPVAFTSGAAVVVPWNSNLANPFGMVNSAGTFTGITGALIVYAQVTLSTTSFTSGQVFLQKNGQTLITSLYPAPTPSAAAGFTTANVEGYVSLLATDVLSVSVSVIGTGTLAPGPAGTTAILVLTAA